LRDSEESKHQEPSKQIENIPVGVEVGRQHQLESSSNHDSKHDEMYNDIDASYSSNDNFGTLSNNEYGESLPSVLSSI
jgi:hypothetical protein